MGTDFEETPINISLIEKRLYLGGQEAAKNLEVLRKYNITHILTINICPLPRNIREQKHLVTKFIHLSDHHEEDLLSHFDETDTFINEAMEKGTILVHCYLGISRSATVVIAHIMKKYQLTFTQAFQRVKSMRKVIFPNLGFVSQLQLYKNMKCQIDNQNMEYKIYKLSLAARMVKQVKILPQKYHNLIQPDPSLEQTTPEPNVYRCKKCRRILAAESNLLLHKNNGVNCKETYFVEPIAWMNVIQENEGKLLCPKCSNKLGSFSWIMGRQCPCGVKVAPAFYLTPSKTDFVNVIKNVETTI